MQWHKAVKAAVVFLNILALALIFPALTQAAVTLPTADIEGADTPVVGRFTGSYIVNYNSVQYDEWTLPLSPLQKLEPTQKDARNNTVFKPQQEKTLAGKHTRLVYLLPEGVSALQAVRNYQNEIKSAGGNLLFECDMQTCGGDSEGLFTGGGGRQGIAKYLWPENKITAKFNTVGHCLQTGKPGDLRFTSLELPGRNAHVAVLTYQLARGGCKEVTGRSVAVVHVIEGENMAQTMDTPAADRMAQAIQTEGRIALYGIYFDSGKAAVKPESAPTLEQIGLLLKSNPSLKLLVVGHTDNNGNYESNLALSKQRADAVTAALTSRYGVQAARLKPVGVAFASPLASNAGEEGKAKNRRVELVGF